MSFLVSTAVGEVVKLVSVKLLPSVSSHILAPAHSSAGVRTQKLRSYDVTRGGDVQAPRSRETCQKAKE